MINALLSLVNFGLLGLPPWYEYLQKNPNDGSPMITGIGDVWLIVAAVIEMLLRIAAVVAIVMVIFGGVEYILSHGSEDQAKKARSTIISALIGLLIAVGAATIVTFIAGRFNGS